MATQKLRILVICTGNSCRSVIAEALLNADKSGRFLASSAGSQPVGFVHPEALAALRRHGIDPGTPSSESWDNYANTSFDVLITVCDSAAAETCPVFPGQAKRLHWSTPDPAHVVGDAATVQAAFDDVLRQLKQRIETEFQ